VNTPAFSDVSGIRRIDPNDGPFVTELVEELDPNTGQIETRRQINWKPIRVNAKLKGGRTVTVKASAWAHWLTGKVQVPVRIADGRKYSGVMDTGYGGYVLINDAVVRDNDLAVFPWGTDAKTGCAHGLCEIPVVSIGPMTFENPRGWYLQWQWQFRVLGVPLCRERDVLIGLKLMRPFAYIRFDNRRSEVVFSPDDAFEPSDLSEWTCLPFILEEVTHDNLKLMVEISMAGVPMRVQFDTGAAKAGLILSEKAWQNVESQLAARGGSQGTVALRQHGWLPCRRFTAPEFKVGHLTLRDKQVFVTPNDSALTFETAGILGLDYFKKTSVVLDFKNNRLWIHRF
jgi:hypothetical protein